MTNVLASQRYNTSINKIRTLQLLMAFPTFITIIYNISIFTKSCIFNNSNLHQWALIQVICETTFHLEDHKFEYKRSHLPYKGSLFGLQFLYPIESQPKMGGHFTIILKKKSSGTKLKGFQTLNVLCFNRVWTEYCTSHG